MLERKIGLFTIASKNYLAYARVLLESVAAFHPNYKTYLCLVDKIDGGFDPTAEKFEVVASDRLGIPYFEDMALRYDIMEFNTAVKPFMFKWLFDTTNLDSLIYLDPDICLYSKMDVLEALLATDVSAVLTPHITRAPDDGKHPDDYTILQAGVFNLGFAAFKRCKESRSYLDWWGGRLETMATVDLAKNLFTDQRWCDLAPCFLDRLHVLKHPGFNAAYWNLAERRIRRVFGRWKANDEPLVFFHFSGINPEKANIVSKHQNRFQADDLRETMLLFEGYRQALKTAGWNETRGLPYAYARTKDGLNLPSIVRRLYRFHFLSPMDFAGANASEVLKSLCNRVSTSTRMRQNCGITLLMEFIYQCRDDLQVAFSLDSRDGCEGFRAWYESAAPREYSMPSELIPLRVSAQDGLSENHLEGFSSTQKNESIEHLQGVEMDDLWQRLPAAVRRLLAPALTFVLTDLLEDQRSRESVNESAQMSIASDSEMSILLSKCKEKLDKLRGPAPIKDLLDGSQRISALMYRIWQTRADLRDAFDLSTTKGQQDYLAWFLISAQQDYRLEPEPYSPSAAQPTNQRDSALRSKPPFLGANVIGYAHADISMGEHVRMAAAALQTTSVPYGVVNFTAGVTTPQKSAMNYGALISDNPHAANLFNVNADQMFLAYGELGHAFFSGRYNIGFWAWELPHCPPEFLPAMDLIDEIWAGSRFIMEAFAERATVPVKYIPECLIVPEFEPRDRRFFGLPDVAFVFLFTFDFLSYVERKNPFATIRAFKIAFPKKNEDVCLVLKVVNADESSESWKKMMRLIDGDRRVYIINKTFTKADVAALFSSADAFVSLHRSEGFGRGPAEAMWLGKPVIATNYSGNTDFMKSSNSCLVDYDLVPVLEGQYPCYSGQHWAEAKTEHAASYMRKLFEDRSYAEKLGLRAQQDIQANFGPAPVGAIYAARLKEIGLA